MTLFNLEDISNLEKDVLNTFERYTSSTPIKQERRNNAWDLLQKFKTHHLPSYVEDLQVSLKTLKVLDFVVEKTKSSSIGKIELPKILIPGAYRLPRTGFYGGLFHDIGKLEVSPEILDKAYGIGEPYTKEDHEIMKGHSQKGYEILIENGFLMSAWIALTAHCYQKDPYPKIENLPPYPKELSSGETLAHLRFVTQTVTLTDHYFAYHRPNKRNSEKPLDKKSIRGLMMEDNADYLIWFKNSINKKSLNKQPSRTQ